MPASGPETEKNRPCILLLGQKLPNPEEIQLSMVGTGKKCEKGGLPIPLVCSGCGHEIKVGTASCGHVDCPSCWSTWAHRGAERMSRRVWGYREASKTDYLPRHVTFDLNVLDWNLAKKKALELGFTGGVLVPHPWRIRPECKQMINDIASSNHTHRYNVVRGLPDWRAVVYYSPHYHMLGYGKGIAIPKDSTEYLYKIISKPGSLDAAQNLAFYLLSHTHIPTSARKASYRYFGTCTSQKLKPTWTYKHSDTMKCSECGKEMVYPGSRTCYTVKVLVQEGWILIKKSHRKKRAAAAPVSVKVIEPAWAPNPCFYALQV